MMKVLLSMVCLTISLILMISCQKSQEHFTNKKPLVQSWYSNNDGEWILVRKVQYEYNSSGELVKELTKRINDGTEAHIAQTTRRYDENGLETKVIRETWRDSVWVFGIQSRYHYEDNRIISRTDSTSKFVSEIEYTYENNLLIEEKPKIEPGDTLRNLMKIQYGYNDHDLPAVKAFPIWKNGMWVNSRKMILDYNDAGHHILTKRYNWKDDKWVEHIRYDLTVDTEGNRLEELWKRVSGDTLATFNKVIYSY